MIAIYELRKEESVSSRREAEDLVRLMRKDGYDLPKDCLVSGSFYGGEVIATFLDKSQCCPINITIPNGRSPRIEIIGVEADVLRVRGDLTKLLSGTGLNFI